MKETKFYQFMSSLSPVEMNRLSKFMESPYFNKNEKLLKIYYAVETNIRDIKPSELTKTAIWDQIFPQVKYDDEKFRKHCSQLMDLAEDWLAQEVYESDRLLKSKFLLQAVFEKKLDKLFSGSTNSAKLTLSKEPLRHSNYYLHNFEIETLLYKIERHDDVRVSKKNLEKINFNAISRNIDYFYISEKLKYYCSILNWKYISNISIELNINEEIVNRAQHSEFNEIPPIAIYLSIYYTYINFSEEKHYYKLKELIEKHISSFPSDEAKSIFDAAINYAIRRSNNRDERYLNELFELYNYALNTELLLVKDEMSQWTFKNIVTNSIGLKEYGWAENFIDNYKLKLNEKVRKNAVTFNKASLEFSKKNYKYVLELLQLVNYEESFYNLGSKYMILCSYYELDEHSALQSFLESFNNYLIRNNYISKNQKIIYSTLISSVKKLLNSNFKYDLLNLKKEIEKASLAGKSWLLEKIDEQILVAKPDPPKKKKK